MAQIYGVRHSSERTGLATLSSFCYRISSALKRRRTVHSKDTRDYRLMLFISVHVIQAATLCLFQRQTVGALIPMCF